MKVLFRLWAIAAGLWECWAALMYYETAPLHNPNDPKQIAIMGAFPFAVLALGYAVKWAFSGGKKHV